MQLDRHIQLLDCPGVVMETGAPTAAAPLRGALAPQRLRDPLTPAAAILRRCPPKQVGSALFLGGGRGQGVWESLVWLRGSQCHCCGVWRWLGVLSLAAVGFRGVMGGLGAVWGWGGFSPTAGDHGGVGGV